MLSARPDPERAWTEFYRNTMRMLRRAAGWSHTVCAADGGWLVLDRAAHSPIG